MTKAKNDFLLLNELFIEFFQQKYIQKQFNRIDSLNISGWEIWLQVELFIFLKEKEQQKVINDVLREQRYELDQRTQYAKRTERKTCAIDLEIMKRNAKSEKWIPIEIKQSFNIRSCITNALQDLEKYNAIKPSEKYFGDFRTPFFLCIFKNHKNNENIASELLNTDPTLKNWKIINIKETNFSVIIF